MKVPKYWCEVLSTPPAILLAFSSWLYSQEFNKEGFIKEDDEVQYLFYAFCAGAECIQTKEYEKYKEK